MWEAALAHDQVGITMDTEYIKSERAEPIVATDSILGRAHLGDRM